MLPDISSQWLSSGKTGQEKSANLSQFLIDDNDGQSDPSGPDASHPGENFMTYMPTGSNIPGSHWRVSVMASAELPGLGADPSLFAFLMAHPSLPPVELLPPCPVCI
jgi:hypothetical protein